VSFWSIICCGFLSKKKRTSSQSYREKDAETSSHLNESNHPASSLQSKDQNTIDVQHNLDPKVDDSNIQSSTGNPDFANMVYVDVTDRRMEERIKFWKEESIKSFLHFNDINHPASPFQSNTQKTFDAQPNPTQKADDSNIHSKTGFCGSAGADGGAGVGATAGRGGGGGGGSLASPLLAPSLVAQHPIGKC
jgi:hypothetical protein